MLYWAVGHFASTVPPIFTRFLTIFYLVTARTGQAALPPGAEDEIVLIEHLPGRRVHLQDFFWTGAEDAPPWLDPDQLLTLYETRTVHHTATIYIPDHHPQPQGPNGALDPNYGPWRPVDCPSCIDPTPTYLDGGADDLGDLGEDPGPRYWLLTVLKGTESAPPRVEVRLARLYKAAFTRQQQKHLGLQPDFRTRRNSGMPAPWNLSDITIGVENVTDFQPPSVQNGLKNRMRPVHMRVVRLAKSKRTFPLISNEDGAGGNTNQKSMVQEDQPLATATVGALVETTTTAGTLEPPGNKSSLNSSAVHPDVGLVQVWMHNTSVLEGGGGVKLIYTVHLGGKPVPAETAAKDMELLSAQEVALVLGSPVIVQSEPYLKESPPLALSRKRDAWLLLSAAGLGLLLLVLIIVALTFLQKRKRAQSPPAGSGHSRRILARKDEEIGGSGIQNSAYSPTEVNSHRRPIANELQSPRVSSDDESELKARSRLWLSYPRKQQRHIRRANAIERTSSPDSIDSAIKTTGRTASGQRSSGRRDDGATGSPHSYLSMPSCKQFPNMRTIEPLSKVLEPVIIQHLDMDNEPHHQSNLKIKDLEDDPFLVRAASASKDPGVLGPIVWDLKRTRSSEGRVVNNSALGHQHSNNNDHNNDYHQNYDHDNGSNASQSGGPMGRARRRINEIIGAPMRKPRADGVQWRDQAQERAFIDARGRSALQVSPMTKPSIVDLRSRPATSHVRQDLLHESIPETGLAEAQSRGIWGSRPLSAGPFHRPNLPEVDVNRVLAESRLRPEDPAVPLIASIKKELGKYSYD